MQIKVTLNKQLAKKFEQIKDLYGLETNSETIRFCITKEYKCLFGNPGKPQTTNNTTPR